jgi:hypothetical protein
MKFRDRFLLSAMLAGSTAVLAGGLDQVDRLTQDQFAGLSRDLAAIAAYRSVTPANALGITGFDVGVGGDAISLQAGNAYAIAGGSGSDSTVYAARLYFGKGLPYGIDIGATATFPSGSGASILGGEARYALLNDALATPAIALRGYYSQAFGVSQLGLRSYGADLMISKKLTVVTPFGGIGTLRTDVTPNGIGTLSAERFTVGRYFVGVNANFLLLDIALEADRTGEVDSISAKFGWRF